MNIYCRFTIGKLENELTRRMWVIDENIRKKLAEMGLNRFYRSGDESISVSSLVNR